MAYLPSVFRCRAAIAAFGLLIIVNLSDSASAQAWRAAIGYDQLLNERGSSLETGAGVTAALVEAGSSYLPSATSSEFIGKTITNVTGTSSGISGHANGVGARFFGNNSSMAPGLTDVRSYEANNWLTNVFANGAAAGDPAVHVSNHSYAGNTSFAVSQQILEGVDQIVDVHDTTSVVAGLSATLIAPSYNSITVGMSSATAGYATTFYGAGRSKPDLVVPESAPSFATPIVSSAAALLHEKAANMGAPDGRRSETIKAVLLAGATKDEFANWDRTTTRPLDEVYGAGELNIYNSYHILEAGEFDGAMGAGSLAQATGWDYVPEFDPLSPLSWNFTTSAAGQFAASLNWNIHVNDPDESFLPRLSLANLDLRLYDSSNTLIDSSLSTVDNLEHIYFNSLGAGTYRLEVNGDQSTDFALAWRSSSSLVSAVPEPGSAIVLLSLFATTCVFRRSRSA